MAYSEIQHKEFNIDTLSLETIKINHLSTTYIILAYLDTYIHRSIHAYMHACIHIYMHTYIHTVDSYILLYTA